jgi:Plant transposon protein
VNFGSPRSRNGIIIYHQSRFFNDIRVGKCADVEPEVTIGDLVLRWFYLLSDGIYPKVKHLANSMLGTLLKKSFSCLNRKLCANLQKGFLLFPSPVFNLIYQPSRLFYKGYM